MVRETFLLSLLGMLALVIPAVAEDEPVEREKYLAEEPIESCIARWDAGTHMSKAQWRQVCKRVNEERLEFLREQGALPEKK